MDHLQVYYGVGLCPCKMLLLNAHVTNEHS